MKASDATRGVSRLGECRRITRFVKLLIINVAVAAIPATQVYAQTESPDKAALLASIEGACPSAWEALDAGFIGGAKTVADPWQGSVSDRDDFIAYLQLEMAGEALTPEELDAMAVDPMAVVAECSYQKLQFMRLMALQASEVTAAGSFTTGVGTGTPAVPDGSTQELAAESCGFIEEAYPSSESGTYWIDLDGGDTGNAQEEFCLFGPPDGSMSIFAASSCNEILTNYPDKSSGVYWIDVNGAATTDAFQVYCDMTASGGGWTMVLAQFESDYLVNWNEGIQPDYDPTLSTSKAFALNASQLPAHSETSFGKSLDATFIDYVDFVYTTSNINKTWVAGKKHNKNYHIHRNTGYGYRFGNPEETTSSELHLRSRFTFDETGGRYRNWCFSVHYEGPARGYSLDGPKSGSYNSYAWTVWVR